MTKLEAIKELRNYDHCLLSPEGVKELGAPFGIYETVTVKDNRSDFKGLTLRDAKEGETAEGLPAHELAKRICDKSGIAYIPQYGIGSQLRVCCDAMEKHLTE